MFVINFEVFENVVKQSVKHGLTYDASQSKLKLRRKQRNKIIENSASQDQRHGHDCLCFNFKSINDLRKSFPNSPVYFCSIPPLSVTVSIPSAKLVKKDKSVFFFKQDNESSVSIVT